MEKQFYVYIHCKPDGTPFYVGKGHGNRGYKFNSRTQYHQNIVAKYGKENIDVLIFPQESEQIAFAVEMKWIAVLRNAEYSLCNLTDGGESNCGHVVLPEVRARISKRMTGMHRQHEHCVNIAKAKIGHTVSHETRVKIANKLKGQPWSQARRNAANKGEQRVI